MHEVVDRPPSRPAVQGGVDGMIYAVRRVCAGDEDFLTASEASSLQHCAIAARRRAAAARLAGRALLAAVGRPEWDLPRRHGQGPRWPAGFVGALAHCDGHAAAVLAPARRFAAVGIDIEPAAPLPPEVYEFVTTLAERRALGGDLVRARLLFCAKEASFKALHRFVGRILEPDELIVDLRAHRAHAVGAPRVRLAWRVDTTILALAAVPA